MICHCLGAGEVLAIMLVVLSLGTIALLWFLSR